MAGWGCSGWICFLAWVHVSLVFAYRSFSTSTMLMTRFIRGAGSLSLALFLTISIAASPAAAQDRPEEGGHELQGWTGGGGPGPGGTKETSVGKAGGDRKS